MNIKKISMNGLFVMGIVFAFGGTTETAQGFGMLCLILWGVNIVARVYKEPK